MIRYTVLTVVILFLSAYAWKDWYRSLCALIVLVAVASYSSMPRAMFGIGGLSPFNFLFANILLSWLFSFRNEKLRWDLPRGANVLLFAYAAIVFISLIRFPTGPTDSLGAYGLVQLTAPTSGALFVDYFVNGIKWVLPGILLFFGCNSRDRLRWGVAAIMLMYLCLAILVIRWMPIGLLIDGDVLQRRAVRVLDREIGFFRTNLSVMFAGAFWVFIAARSYFEKKYSLIIGGAALVILLAMFLTGGRGGYLAWAAVGLLVSFAKWRRYLILGPLLLLLVFALFPSVQDRILGGQEDPDTYQATLGPETRLAIVSAGRTEAWPRVVDKITESPVTGYGFLGVVTSGVTEGLIRDYNYTFFHPHNAYLQILIDNGLLGSIPILILFYFIAKFSWSLFRDSRNPDYALAGGIAVALVFTFLVAGMTGQSFYPEERSVGMWCAIALMARVAIGRHRMDSRT